MDYGRLAIARALQDQSLGPILDRGLAPEMMPTPEDGAVLKFVLDFHKKHRTVPSPTLVEQQFPGYSLKYAPDPCGFYVGEILKQHVRNRVAETILRDAKKVVVGDPFDVATGLRTDLNRLLLLGNEHIELTVDMNTDERLQRYLTIKQGVGLIGIRTPWPSLDDITLGWQPEMYFGFVARPGVGKTWCMTRVGHAAWVDGNDVLFVNKEMPTELMSQRFDALHFKLPYGRFRTGDLTDAEEKRYRDGLVDLAKNPPAKWTWVHGAMTVSGIAAKIEELKPKLVLVDGAYLLRDEEGAKTRWERYENISRGLKRLAQEYKVPVGISIQLNRGGDIKNRTHKNGVQPMTLADVMGTDAFAQDVDYLFALDQTDDLRANRQMMLRGLKTREAESPPVLVGWDFETMESKDFGVTTQVVVSPDEDEETLDF